MPSMRQQIVLATAAALDAPEKPAGCVVHRMRAKPIEHDAFALVVYNGKEVATPLGGAGGSLTVRKHIVRIEARAAGEAVDDALDPLLVWAVEALLADPTLGGLANGLQEHELTWELAQGEETHGVAYMDVIVEYQTLRTDSTRRR